MCHLDDLCRLAFWYIKVQKQAKLFAQMSRQPRSGECRAVYTYTIYYPLSFSLANQLPCLINRLLHTTSYRNNAHLSSPYYVLELIVSDHLGCGNNHSPVQCTAAERYDALAVPMILQWHSGYFHPFVVTKLFVCLFMVVLYGHLNLMLL